jgi:DNA-binding NarL/FixJ family response regulator
MPAASCAGSARAARPPRTNSSARVRPELVADGRSNKEDAGALFVSEKTVEAALMRIYAKLGVRSRVELAKAR